MSRALVSRVSLFYVQTKADQIARIDAALTFLHALWSQLGTNFEVGYAAMTDDVTDARLSAIQERIRLSQIEMAERTTFVKTRLAECFELCQTLSVAVGDAEAADEALHAKIMAQDVDAVGVHHQALQQLDDKCVVVTAIVSPASGFFSMPSSAVSLCS